MNDEKSAVEAAEQTETAAGGAAADMSQMTEAAAAEPAAEAAAEPAADEPAAEAAAEGEGEGEAKTE